jgi:hypothetical protein
VLDNASPHLFTRKDAKPAAFRSIVSVLVSSL